MEVALATFTAAAVPPLWQAPGANIYNSSRFTVNSRFYFFQNAAVGGFFFVLWGGEDHTCWLHQHA